MNAPAKIENKAPETLLPADPMVSMIERVAMDPNADIEKLERMLAMKERLDTVNAQTSFNEAMAQAQAEMPNVAAKHNNDQTKSKYAKLADIYKACKPIAAKHGFSFSVVPVAGGRDGYMNMKWTLRRGAHIESDVSEVPLDDAGMKGTKNKTETHAYGSTTSYGRRYLFCAVFDIAIGDDDDGNKPAAPRDPWTHTIISELPEDATPRDKAFAIATALCAQWKRMKGERQMSNEWDRRVHLIEGPKALEGMHPDLHETVVDGYENRMNEIRESA